MTFDSRAAILATEIQDGWSPDVKALWLENQRAVAQEVARDFGPGGIERKLADLKDLGPAPFSVVSYHNAFLADARHAFVAGAYYSSLTGACCLGERVINEMVLRLRSDYSQTLEHAEVSAAKSVPWRNGARVLQAWEVLLPDVGPKLIRLYGYRNGAVHYSARLAGDVRSRALRAMRAIQEVIQTQFGAFGQQPWYIPGIAGASYVGTEWEDVPFVRRFVLPSCVAVSPRHRMEFGAAGWSVFDPDACLDGELTDEEFAAALSRSRGTP